MGVKAWQLPWQEEMVPHAVLDILRECNISCRACYNTGKSELSKSLVQIGDELDALLKLRRLSSVSILGGEVTLHPQLCEIVRMVRARGLGVELITNGLKVERKTCRQLKEAGLNVIYYHIERGQKRGDLCEPHSADDINKLRLAKAAIAGEEGLDVGLTVTAYPGEMDDLHDAVSLTLETPEINYLLVTLFRDHSGVTSLRGNILSGFFGTGTPPDAFGLQNNTFFAKWLNQEFGIEPFGCMGSNLDLEDPRWMSYLVGTVYGKNGEFHFEYIRPSLLEKFAMMLYRIAGRYPMYIEQNADRFRRQLVLNGLLGGRRRTNMELVRKAGKAGARLSAKRLLFQNPAELTADGRLIHCKWCPDAVLKAGSLVPVCIADHVS